MRSRKLKEKLAQFMTNIDQIINEASAKESSRRARWIDIQIMQLLSPFYQQIIKSSLTPDLIKKAIMRVSGIEIVEDQFYAGVYVTRICIKQHGVVKASRIYS